MAQERDSTLLLREGGALLVVFFCVLLSVSLYTYSVSDPSFTSSGTGSGVANKAGIVGAYLAGLVVDVFGVGGFALPLLLVLAALTWAFPGLRLHWWRWTGALLVLLCALFALESGWFADTLTFRDVSGGGSIGAWLRSTSYGALKSWGSWVVWAFLLLTGVQLLTGLSWFRQGARMGRAWTGFRKKQMERKAERSAPKASSPVREPRKAAADLPAPPRPRPSPPKPKSVSPVREPREDLPAVELLSAGEEEETAPPSASELDAIGRAVTDCLSDFGIQGEVNRVRPGPVVNMVEYKPAPGVKISRIAGLSSDLALALKAQSVRIVAPLPGTDAIGLEVPNRSRRSVVFRDVIASSGFGRSGFRLPLALGKDIEGRPVAMDLARMPHLLVAGATGAGKSVCLNSIIVSLLFSHAPAGLRLLLIDPKRIELAAYGALPHLVHPVVTDMHLAKSALEWAVSEMEQRYEAMARLGVRHLDAYNEKVRAEPPREGEPPLEPMPYLVIVVDELADLMLTASKEVEVSIVRLAQLARAAGIHLILATQRPSVDVVTGLIKANFPARIAFQVSSRHDSRTILDASGAEALLGRGDMLFKGPAGRMDRVHGCYVPDEDIHAVIDFWRSRAVQRFDLDFTQWKEEQEAGGEGGGGDVTGDPQYREAVDFVIDQGKASISLVQRRLRIGFNRAARFIEAMEEEGIIGPQEGSKPRRVIGRR